MEKFKSIPELIQSLNQLAIRINKGTVGLEEFESKLHDARELYERLVILRYKAIEDRNLMGMYRSQDTPEEPVEQPKVEEPVLGAKQISLIDSIEEIAREEKPVQQEEKEGSKAPEHKPQSEQKPETESKAKKSDIEEKPKSDVIPPPEPRMNPSKSSALPDSLAEKLSQTKIHDLNVAIGLNQKFRFIKELFDGDTGAYNEAVKTLNHCENLQEADRKTSELMNTYQWDEEDQVTLSFLNLIERRYQ